MLKRALLLIAILASSCSSTAQVAEQPPPAAQVSPPAATVLPTPTPTPAPTAIAEPEPTAVPQEWVDLFVAEGIDAETALVVLGGGDWGRMDAAFVSTMVERLRRTGFSDPGEAMLCTAQQIPGGMAALYASGNEGVGFKAWVGCDPDRAEFGTVLARTDEESALTRCIGHAFWDLVDNTSAVVLQDIFRFRDEHSVLARQVSAACDLSVARARQILQGDGEGGEVDESPVDLPLPMDSDASRDDALLLVPGNDFDPALAACLVDQVHRLTGSYDYEAAAVNLGSAFVEVFEYCLSGGTSSGTPAIDSGFDPADDESEGE